MSRDDEYLSIEKRPPESLLRTLLTYASGEYRTPHGQMMVRGEITKSQYAACKWFDELYERYLKAIGRSRGIRTSTGERVEPGRAPDPLSEAGQRLSEAEARTVRDYDSAKLAAISVGHKEFQIFWAVIIDERMMSGAPSAVRLVAESLEKHRGLGSRHRRGRRRA